MPTKKSKKKQVFKLKKASFKKVIKIKSKSPAKKNKARKVKPSKPKIVVKKISSEKYNHCKLNAEALQWFKDFHSFTNYVAASCLYLKDNFLLRRPLRKDDLKDRVLGHWGTVPGLNFIYANCNYLVKKHDQKAIFITGPGHGAPANLACNFLDGSMEYYYSEYTRDYKGLGRMMKDFSWPYKLPSHVTPAVPGSILEGGELGYSLSTAFGAVMDKPEMLVFCVVGDGESETGATAAAWHSNKFLNPKESGAVLPIVHVNGYKISGPTIYSTMSDEELDNLFKGYGYFPLFVEQKDDDGFFMQMADKMEQAYQMIQSIQKKARKEHKIFKPIWPMIVLRSKKGWTGVKRIGDHKIEDNFRSHGVPMTDVKKNPEQFKALEKWLNSYNINQLVDRNGRPLGKLYKYIPKNDLRLGTLKEANAGQLVKDLPMPKIDKYEFKGRHGQLEGRNTAIMTEWLSDLMVEDAKKNKMIRFFCPDETDSNKFTKLIDTVGREYIWPVKKDDENIVNQGRVSEMLSEQTLQGWLQGYNLTGRYGIFCTYEAFAMITASMVDQHLKFIKQASRIKWRKPIPSLNYILSSVEWRQEHNGYSHQNPSFISNVLEKHGNISSVFFPCDGNTLLVVMEECLKRRNFVNVIEACKQEIPQWQTLSEAREQLKKGISTWEWVDPQGARNPDIVFSAAGDYMVEEMMAAIDILKNEFPEFKIRFVNVLEMTANGIGSVNNPIGWKNLKDFYKYYTEDKPVIFNFHGYPQLVQKLLWGVPDQERFVVNGYQEEGSTTTPFDMHVRNGTSRFQIVIEAMQAAGIVSKDQQFAKRAWAILKKYQKRLVDHKQYVIANGKDFADVADWRWGK
jgi:xylulose-5-phosphate/fructose-6-phosphate phosphoketolase